MGKTWRTTGLFRRAAFPRRRDWKSRRILLPEQRSPIMVWGITIFPWILGYRRACQTRVGTRHGGMSDFISCRRRPPHLPLRGVRNQSGIVLVTVCTQERRPILARQSVMEVLCRSWREAEAWLVGRFVLLPDHLHVFCAPSGPAGPSLRAWVQYWKALATRRWPEPRPDQVWQQSFWDRQLRTGEHYGRRWEYVRRNPVRHGFVNEPADWPYQGELNVFWFHDG